MTQYTIRRAQVQDQAHARVVLGFLATPLVLMFAIAGAMLAAA